MKKTLADLGPISPGKFIRLPKLHLKWWLEALRLPANQKMQGAGALFDNITADDEGVLITTRESIEATKGAGYCCLGVGQYAISGGVEQGAFPSNEWMHTNGWEFYDEDSTRAVSNNPWLLLGTASDLNDSRQMSFLEIAALIEAAAETY